MSLTEKQLGQLRPANTTAASLYSPPGSTIAIVKTILICETAGTGAAFRIFVDDDGSTFDETTAIFWDATIAADTTVLVDLFIGMDDSNGNLGVRTDTANALTFTAFGAEIT